MTTLFSERQLIVMVVDDDPTVRFLVQEVATGAGFRACESPSGEEALEKIPEVRPDLVFLDVNMAPGLDGFETCEALRRSGFGKPVVMMTGSDLVETARRGAEAGATDVIGKPFRLADLGSFMRGLLGAPR